MRSHKAPMAFFMLILLLGATPDGNVPSCREIIDNMLDTIRHIKTQSFSVHSTERVDGHLLFAESYVKVNVNPRKIYFNNPSKGIEVLWVEGSNKGNASVHTRSVPLVNFDLDPYGSIMRKDQHHTIFDLGMHSIGTTIASTILRSPKEFDKHFSYAGTLIWNQKECYQVLISYPEYKYVEYTVLRNETVTSIAKKLGTSDFKMRYKNGLSSYFGTIKEGRKLLIPVPYANKAILYIDKRSFLPVSLKVYDEEGLYESYEFHNIRINKGFAANEFSKNYKDYGF